MRLLYSRQTHPQRAPFANLAFHLNAATRRGDDPIRDRQPQTHPPSASFRGEKGVKDVLAMLGRDPAPGVGDAQFDESSLVRRVNGELAPLGHGIFGVAHHIQNHLLQLIRGDEHER